jgi:hypothetical protein
MQSEAHARTKPHERQCRLSGELQVLADIQSLAKLVVSDNPITNLPEALGAQQQHLNEVLASQCRLKTVPAALASAPRLLKLAVSGNGLQFIYSNLLKGVSLPWQRPAKVPKPNMHNACTIKTYMHRTYVQGIGLIAFESTCEYLCAYQTVTVCNSVGVEFVNPSILVEVFERCQFYGTLQDRLPLKRYIARYIAEVRSPSTSGLVRAMDSSPGNVEPFSTRRCGCRLCFL